MAVARLAIAHHAQTGEVPSKQYFIEAYYGENPGPVNLFIGFDQFSVFDMPLVATGNEDLYFTVCPSPYLSSAQLRGILYDHLYTRHQEPDYAALGPDDWHVMQKFYRLNQDKTLGIGINRGSIWYPLARIELPAELQGPAVQ